MLHEEIFAADSKIYSRKRGKKATTKPVNPADDSYQICKYFFDIKYGIGLNRFILIAGFAGSC